MLRHLNILIMATFFNTGAVSLVETIDSNGCGSGTLYNISPDNSTWYYWTGAAWGIANGTVSKANPATTVTSNLSTFANQVGAGTVYFKVFLQSNGTSACAIDSLSVSGTH